MKIISIVNEKGGSGKTTTAVSYFGSFMHDGKSVVIIDLDVNGQAAHILSKMGDGNLNGRVLRADKTDEVSVLKMLKTLDEAGIAEIVIFDTPPSLGEAFETAISIASSFNEDGKIVVPCQPSAQDIALTNKTIAAIHEYCFCEVFVQPTNTRTNEHMTQVLKMSFVAKSGVELLPSLDRSAPLSQAAMMGLTPHEFKPKAAISDMINRAASTIHPKTSE